MYSKFYIFLTSKDTMKKENYIPQQIDKTLEIGSQLTQVEISHQFKEKVMSQLFTEKEISSIFSWFTPKLQLATLAMIIFLNTLAVTYISQSNYKSNIQTFAQSFNLSTKETILN